jgi:hypothetical protein
MKILSGNPDLIFRNSDGKQQKNNNILTKKLQFSRQKSVNREISQVLAEASFIFAEP